MSGLLVVACSSGPWELVSLWLDAAGCSQHCHRRNRVASTSRAHADFVDVDVQGPSCGGASDCRLATP